MSWAWAEWRGRQKNGVNVDDPDGMKEGTGRMMRYDTMRQNVQINERTEKVCTNVFSGKRKLLKKLFTFGCNLLAETLHEKYEKESWVSKIAGGSNDGAVVPIWSFQYSGYRFQFPQFSIKKLDSSFVKGFKWDVAENLDLNLSNSFLSMFEEAAVYWGWD